MSHDCNPWKIHKAEDVPPRRSVSAVTPVEFCRKVETLRWIGDVDGHLVILDQTLLPGELRGVTCHEVESVWEAIRQLRVRGAPAIGIAAAYGVYLGLRTCRDSDPSNWSRRFEDVASYLAASRPTAVNLCWSLERMRRHLQGLAEESPTRMLAGMLQAARAIHDEDRAICRAIGEAGAPLISDGAQILTHCNTGGLATSEYGTALAVIFTAQDQGKAVHVYVDETRPLLQGARLTAWELQQRGVPATLICDSMAAQVMKEGRIDLVITGADRIAANGDAANKIGTYGLAVLARAHSIPFYVAAPCSTFDLSLANGDGIPIEVRPAEEITQGFGRVIAPKGISVYNPAFDVTPAGLIQGIVTERGLIQPVTKDAIFGTLGR